MRAEIAAGLRSIGFKDCRIRKYISSDMTAWMGLASTSGWVVNPAPDSLNYVFGKYTTIDAEMRLISDLKPPAIMYTSHD